MHAAQPEEASAPAGGATLLPTMLENAVAAMHACMIYPIETKRETD